MELRLGGPGIKDLARLQRDLKAAPKQLRREVYRALERSTQPLKEAAREGAREHLPQSGGLADRVATASIKAKLRGGASPSLSLQASQTGAAADRFKKARSADKRATRKRLKKRGTNG